MVAKKMHMDHTARLPSSKFRNLATRQILREGVCVEPTNLSASQLRFVFGVMGSGSGQLAGG